MIPVEKILEELKFENWSKANLIHELKTRCRMISSYMYQREVQELIKKDAKRLSQKHRTKIK